MFRLQGHSAIPTDFCEQLSLIHCEFVVEPKDGHRAQNHHSGMLWRVLPIWVDASSLAYISAAVAFTYSLPEPPSQMRTWGTHSSSFSFSVQFGRAEKTLSKISTLVRKEAQGLK